MADVGQVARALIARRSFTVAAVVAAALGAFWLRSFTVDDALIPVRYARHLAAGAGYRWNVDGPPTDGVTPLPWAFLLAPLAHGSAWVVLGRAKAVGVSAWLAAAALWGSAVDRADAPPSAKAVALAGLGASLPLAAYAVSGMETALATALATCAAVSHRRPRVAACLAGLSASLRPELLPWAVALSVLFACARAPRRRAEVAWAAALAGVPFAACVLARVLAFGRPAPLSLLAKPSDLAHGASYALAAALVSVGPLLALAPAAAARERGPGRAILLAGAVHLAAIVVAGGDWMPFARLVAPVTPSLLYAAVLFWRHARSWVWLLRAGVAIAVGARALISLAPAAGHVGEDRAALAHRVAPLLAGLPRVAAVDIGWVSAATEAHVVDLAGVTDPDVAALGGGHTSKRVDGAMLLALDPDALILYAEMSDAPLGQWRDAVFPRVVEGRLARDERVAARFEAVALVPVGQTGSGYYVLRRRR